MRAFGEIADVLQTYPDLDRMLTGLTAVPKQLTLTTARCGINTLLFVKETLRASKLLAAAVSELTVAQPDALLSSIAGNLCNTDLEDMEVAISRLICEGNALSKSQQEMRHQECFAISSGVDGMLDVARKTYLQTVEEIYQVMTDHCSSYIPINMLTVSSTNNHCS